MFFSLAVFFEDPWWVGLFTISDQGAAQYCRVVFGKEPTDTEVYKYFLNNYYQLKFTDGIPAMPENPMNGNPKRRKREISKQLKSEIGVKTSYEIIKESIKQSKKKARLRKEKSEKVRKMITSYKKRSKKERPNTRGIDYLIA